MKKYTLLRMKYQKISPHNDKFCCSNTTVHHERPYQIIATQISNKLSKIIVE